MDEGGRRGATSVASTGNDHSVPGQASLSKSVYTRIKELILSNQLRPGAKLTHDSLAQILDVSRTPVREALERLTQEGFAQRLARRGYFVSEISEDEARQLYEVRRALELFALDLSFEHGFTEGDLAPLEEIMNQYKVFLDENRTRDRMLIDRDFHLKLASLSGNEILLRMLEQAFERLLLKRRIDGYFTDRGHVAHTDHVKIMDALRQHDRDAAYTALNNHLLGAWQAFLVHMEAIRP
ncbi:GntR family transcriptional regulator [Candidimonas nitroreducens]|uniref:HTH gntR-type domain-containing protein n=1 Tax=Candidimonas nitroreducens TaxID=683354 RepID=A0A225MQH3_9BURK|nr:GntR family transcriptional regulator [Candidimonas nitroreducens]OWT61691.1 hypothetical protein CEY11_07520 [Candidimonas nitroreducens]